MPALMSVQVTEQFMDAPTHGLLTRDLVNLLIEVHTASSTRNSRTFRGLLETLIVFFKCQYIWHETQSLSLNSAIRF